MKARRKMMPTPDLFFCRDNEAKCKQTAVYKTFIGALFYLNIMRQRNIETLVLQVFKNTFIWCLVWHYTSALYCNCIKLEPTQSCIPTWWTCSNMSTWTHSTSIYWIILYTCLLKCWVKQSNCHWWVCSKLFIHFHTDLSIYALL